MSQLTMQLETITPAQAKEYLARNIRNRALQKATVDLYARQMKHGDWVVNGDAVRFNVNEELSDGQHRLQAVVESGVPLTTFVLRGLPVEDQVTIDQQRKRTAGDMLKMRGISNGNNVAAIVRMVDRWDCGERSMFGFTGGHVPLSAKEAIALLDKDQNLYIEAMKKATNHALLGLAVARVTGSLFVLTSRIDAEKAEEFFDSLIKGTGLEEGDPVLTLRRYWSRMYRTGRRANTGVYMMAGVRAWNAYVEGRKISQIGWRATVIPEMSVPKPTPSTLLDFDPETLMQVSS